MQAHLIIRSAKSLPKLGLYTLPSPYIIVKAGDMQDATPICNSTCNPQWNHEVELSAAHSLEIVTFYVYNNNPNYVDQLLGVGSIEFETFMTPAMTKCRIMLTDAVGNYLSSYLQVEHQDAHPPPVNSALLNPMTTIRVSLLGITATLDRSVEWLKTFNKKCIQLTYGEQIKQLSSSIPIITFRYDAKQTQIAIKLQLTEKIVLSGQFSMENIRQNTSMRVRLYYGNHQVIVLLGASMIANGYLPDKHNTFILQISNIMIQPIKKVPKNWSLVIYSVFGKQIIKKLNQPYRLYIQNNTNLQFQYFEDVQDRDLQIMEPMASHSIPVNSINWSNAFNAEENIKMYNPVRGIVFNIDLKCTLLKTQKQSGLMPELIKPNFMEFYDKTTYQIYQIKMSNACFTQIFPQKTMFYLAYFSDSGTTTVFPIFQVKNSTQYLINCKQSIKQQDRGGCMCLLTFDHFFGKQKENQNDFQNYIICKLPCKSLKQLTVSQAIFSQKFLAFAKKKSLTSPCKKFDLMVKDKILTITLSYKTYPIFQPGLLKIRNSIIKGGQGKVQVFIIFDSNQLCLQGQYGSYLMNKNYSVKLKDNGIQFKVVQQGMTKHIYSQFQKVFGMPQLSKIYIANIQISQSIQLSIIYSFQPIKIPDFLKPVRPKQIYRFKADSPIHLRMKSATMKHQNCHSFVLRVSKGSTIYETLKQNPTGQYIRFRDSQKMYFQKQSKNDYMFFNLYCQNAENALVVYAGHLNVKHVIGKGMYQLILSQLGQKQNKNAAMINFQVLNNLPLPHAAVKLTLTAINMSNQQFLKSILKYYLVCQVKQTPIGIFQLIKTNDGFKVKQSSVIKNGQNVVWKLYSSIKSLNTQTFWNSDKELIASGKLVWAKIESKGIFLLRFLPPRDLSTKLNSNSLALLQNSVKIILQYMCQPQPNDEIVLNNKLAKPIQIDVLHSGAAIINILQILPYCSFDKTLQLQILPFSFECCAQSRFTLNKTYVTELNNMKMKISVIRSIKSKEKYSKQYDQQQVNFRGKQLKTTQKIGFVVDFAGICLVKADAIILSNKFTSNPNGTLTVRNLSYQKSTILDIQIYPLKSWRDIRQQIDKITPIKLDFRGINKMDINTKFATNQITFGLYFIITFSDNTKCKILIQIARIHIEKLDDKPFTYQWIVQNSKNVSVMHIQAEYKPNKVEEVEVRKVEYSVQANSQIINIPIEYRTKQKIGIIDQANRIQMFRPDRKRGYRVIVNMPDKLSAKAVRVILSDDTKIDLKKSEHNGKVYVYNSTNQFKIKSLQLQSNQVERIQELEQKNFTRRFLINRDPTLIVYLIKQPYAIADCKPQSIAVSFRLHQIYSSQTNKKILWMRNNKNDQILTKHLSLLIKHGGQKKIIRNINQNGDFDIELERQVQRQTVSFGYEPLADQLQIFLCINHALNQKQQAQKFDCDDLKNWVQLFPVAYGKVNLQRISKKSLIGCSLKKIQNFNETLDKQLNQIIQRPNLNCLGVISMQKRRWGYICLHLLQISALQLQFSSPTDLIYFTLEIQSSKRKQIAKTTTEARNFNNSQKLIFITNKLKFFYFEQKNETESLKITATLLTFNNSFILFQKRIDLSEVLRQPGAHPISTQIKPIETKGIKNLVQIKFTLTNSSSPQKEVNVLEQARKINKIDIVSFENYNEGELVDKLTQCQQPTHLLEVLTQLKESVIYSKESQFQLFKTCGFYLQFQNDNKIISTLLEMMNIQVLKYPQVVQKLNENQTKKIYEYIKIICQCSPLEVKNTLKRMSTSEYSLHLSIIDKNKTDGNLKYQKMKLYTPQEASNSASLIHIEPLLTLIGAFVKKSKIFRQLFRDDIKNWDQIMSYKQDSIFMKYFHLINQIFVDAKIPLEIIQDFLVKGMNKNMATQPLLQMWSKLPKQKMLEYNERILKKLISRFDNTKEGQQSVQNFRSFINHINMQKLEVPIDFWRQAISKCGELIQKNNDFITLSSYGQLLGKMNSLGYIQQNQKVELVSSLKKKQASEHDKNIKLVLGNIIDKICGKKPTVQQATTNKAQFYKKYLITS